LKRNIAPQGCKVDLYSAARTQKKSQTKNEVKSQLFKVDMNLNETATAMFIEKKGSPELISNSGERPVSHEIL
jgi:hypothetical protein